MTELENQIVSELDQHLGQLQEPVAPRVLAQQIAAKRPDLVERLTVALGNADEAREGILAVIVEALDRPHMSAQALKHPEARDES